MVIKNGADVKEYLISKYDDISMMSSYKRDDVLSLFLNLYHFIREAERCKYTYKYSTDEERRGIKDNFEFWIDLANGNLNAIEDQFKILKGGGQKKGIDFEVLGRLDSVEEQKQYIDDVLSNEG